MSGPNRLSNRRLSVAVLPPWLRAAALTVAVALPMIAVPALAGELYQWKDANGVTHYSDSPPPAGADYENRTIRDSGAASAAPEVAAAPAENNQCTTARGNLALLQGEGPVGVDTDDDGKPDTEFTAEQRANQSQLAEAAIKVHCSGSAEPASTEAS